MFSLFFSFFFDEIYSFSVVYGAQFAIYKFYKWSIMGQRRNVRALAGICEFHLSYL